MNGWTLAARVDFMDTEHSGRKGIVCTVPGQSTPDGLHHIDETCEHCFKDRKRNRIYIFKNGEQWKRVGSTCIQDYIGLDAKMLLHCTEAPDVVRERRRVVLPDCQVLRADSLLG